MTKGFRVAIIVVACAALAVAVVLGGYFGFIATNMLDAPDLSAEGVRYIAHRGLSSTFYENTENAFRAAAASDFFFGIETDIYRTADGRYVCAHDENPFADESLRISELPVEECLRLPLSVSDDYGMSGENERLCSLENYLSACSDGGKTAVMELKPDFSAEQIAEILDIAYSVLPKDKVIVISFSSSNIEKLAARDDGTRFMFLGTNTLSAEFFARRNCPVGLNADKADGRLVSRIHDLGVTLNVWNVTSAEQAAKLVADGVDFITTDFDFSA